MQQFEVWREDVEPALQSKADEFHFLGYDRTSIDDIWDCVLAKVKKKKTHIHLHEFVHYILTLKPNEYMTWLTIEAYKGPDWFASEKPMTP
ncbi:post-transcriptional regulator [Desertibacillus haloalkaliphilus]|nr:post-transcriptional regulator [Desertibacillus haloalkaliphilus]